MRTITKSGVTMRTITSGRKPIYPSNFFEVYSLKKWIKDLRKIGFTQLAETLKRRYSKVLNKKWKKPYWMTVPA